MNMQDMFLSRMQRKLDSEDWIYLNKILHEKDEQINSLEKSLAENYMLIIREDVLAVADNMGLDLNVQSIEDIADDFASTYDYCDYNEHITSLIEEHLRKTA